MIRIPEFPPPFRGLERLVTCIPENACPVKRALTILHGI